VVQRELAVFWVNVLGIKVGAILRRANNHVLVFW
jgi:hypothetical protein